MEPMLAAHQTIIGMARDGCQFCDATIQGWLLIFLARLIQDFQKPYLVGS